MSKKKHNQETPVQETKQENLDELLGLSTEVTAEAEQPVVEVQEETIEVTEEVAAPADEAEQPDLFPETLPKTQPSGLTKKIADADGVVKDAKGNVLFRRIQKKAPEVVTEKKRTRIDYKKADRYTDASGGRYANPALLTFPTDRWGLTKDIKKALITAASRVAGDENKKKLVEDTLDILRQHLTEKFAVDAAYRKSVLKSKE